jgi:hypothetical protein
MRIAVVVLLLAACGGALDTGPGGLYEVDNLVVKVTGSCPL